MATVNVDIVSNFNTDSLEKATQYIRQQRLELSQMQQDIASSMDGMSSPATMLVDQLMRAVQTADQFAEKAKEASGYLTGEGSRSEEEDTSMSYQLQSILDDFNAMKQVLTGSGSFSVDLAKSMFQSLPSEIQKQFNAITPQIVANLRTGMSALYKGKNKIDSSDIPGIVSDAMWMPQIEKLLSTTSASQAQKEAFVKALIPNAMPVQRSAEYQIARFGTTLGQTKRPQTVEEVLPEAFKGWYDNGGHLSRNVESPSEILGINGTTKLLRNISSNPIAARAAIQSGLMARDSAGVLTLNNNVSREKLLDYRDALLNEFYTRTNGLYRHITDTGDYFTDKDETQQKIIQRAQSGTGGETLAAMRSFNDIWSKEDFGPATEGVAVKRQIRPEDEAKRKKEMYTVGKVSPFLPVGTKTSDGNDDAANQRVAIAESQMTRLLDLQGKNYSYTPAVKMVSMAGYDENNPEHVALLRNYLQNGYTNDEGHYTVHTTHGTGNNTVLRMIRDEERESITDKYRPFAHQLGLKGDDVLNAFVPKWQLNDDKSIKKDDNGQYIPYEFENPQALGKHIEQLNKMWTDSYETGADLSQKDFALIDFSRLQKKYGKQSKIEFSNGLGFLGTGMGPAAFQARFGISGKGSFYNTGTETLGEWAERAGLLDDQGRFMVPGIDGTEFDASKYHGAMDLSMIKNQLAYQGLSNEKANRALTGLVRKFPLQVAADYGYDDKANSLGSQMSTFLAYSPDIMLHQAKNLGSRLLELETLQGQRKYVFNNPEADEVAQLANDPVNGDRFMLTDPRVRERVETYKKSLMQDVGAGEFINYNSIADIQNERLLRSPVAAYFMTKGGMTEEQIADYQQRFKNAHRANFQKEYLDQIDRSSLSEDEILRAEENARRQAEEALNAQFTAENVRKYMMLEGGVADFGHIDNDEVAALRSPTGFDQVIVRKNYAKYLKPIYEQMGESVTGFHGNEEDYLTLAGADMDADMVKAVADKDNLEGTKVENGKTIATKLSLVDDIKKLKERTAALGIKDFESEIKTQKMPTLEGGNNMENVDNWIRMVQLSLMAPLEMGKYSDAGSRLAGNLDLLDNSMRFAAATAMKANKGYDPATTLNKKPLQIMQDYAIGQALALGQEYSKIPAHLEDAYNVMKQEDDKGNIFYTTKDGKTVIDAQNVFKTSSGHLINKTYFDRLDKTNLPSVHSTSAMLAMLGNKMAFANGLVDTQLLDDLMEVFGVTEPSNGKTEGEAIGYNGAGEATKRLMKNMRAIRAQHYGFQRYKETDDELDILASQYAESKQEIRNQFFERLKTENLGDQRIMEDGQAMDQDTYERHMAKKYGLEQVENMLGRTKIGPNGRKVTVSTGASDTSIRARYGEGISTMLNNQENVSLADSTRGVIVDPRLADYYIYGEQSHRHAIGRVAEDKIDTKPTKKRKPSIKTLEKNLASLRSEINNETGLTSTLFDMEDEDYASMLEDMRKPTSQYQNTTTEQRRKLNGLIDKWQSTYREIKQRKAPQNKTKVSSLSQNKNGSVPPSPPSPPDGPNGPFDPNGLLGWSSYEQFFSDLGMGNEKAVQAVLQGQGAMMAWENIRERSARFKSSMMKEAKKQTDITDSDSWYASTLGMLNSLGESVQAVKQVGGKRVDTINNSTASNDEKAYNDAVASFSVGRSAHVQSTIDSTLKFLDRSINGKGTKSDQQEEILKKWEDQKTNLESEKNNYLLSLTTQTDIDKQGNDKSSSEVAKLDKAIKEAQEKIDAGRKKLFEGNAQSIEDAASSFDQIIEGKDQSPQSKINRTLKKAKDSLADMRNDLEDYFSHNLIDPEEYKRLDQELKNRETKLNDGTYKKQLATYLNYDEKIQQAKSRIGLRQTAAELAGHVLTPDQEIAQATEKMIINRNSLINSLRRSGNNTDADRVERQFTDGELQRVARNDYNRTLRLRREQEQNRQTQLQSSYLMDDQRLNMTDKLVGNQRQALRFNELNRINSAITARNQERASYEKELNTLRDRDRLSRSGSAVMSNTDRSRLTELEQRDVALRLQIAGYQSQRSNLDNRLQYQDRNIENADRLRREQQRNRNTQSNRQYEADERRLSGESTTVQGRNADIRDQELNRIQNQRHSNNQQIEQNRQRIQALRNQRRSGTLSKDEISELAELEVANRQLRSNNVGLNRREQNIDSYLQLQYNANARQDQTRQAQQAARAAQMAMQHQQTTDTFNFDQNRVENIARRANDQMMNQLRQANVQDLDLINTNRTRLEQLARKGRNGGVSLVNGQMVLGNAANKAEWDRLQREITEAERRRSDREAQMQDEEYLRRNREMAQRQDDLQATQMHDQYIQAQRRHEQVRRNRYGGQYGIAGRLLSLRDNRIQESTSIRQGYERDIVNTQNALMKYTDGNGNLKNNLSDEERQKAQQLQQDLAGYQQSLAQARKEEEQMSGIGGTVAASFDMIGQSVQRLTQRLGRQIFQKALQEAKRFVKEFDASMNEIQAITMKSNDEMRDVRTGTINRAIGLRTSVSNVATTEAELYRQGLSDTEVADRTESIIKFATVTKLNVSEATKIITTALQNDLVPSAEAAMDALVALGDSAATTAAEIGKGMQKAAASAKVAGVSYEELTALLTIGTSDTQLSGTQVGTALQTVFSRMRRLSLTGYTADQNGEKTTASDAEAALAAVGVDLWDNKTVGQMRSAYDVMLDLSKVWQNLSDAQKSIVTNAMAGTRQTNIFSTLMEGMSEDNGATLEKYLGLAEGSEGVTQSKYEIAMQSLAASMDTVRSSWDAVVESFTNSGVITGALDGVSDFLQLIASVASNGGQVPVVLSAIAAGIAGITAACLAAKTALAPVASFLGLVGGLVVGGIGVGLSSLAFGPDEDTRNAQQREQAIATTNENISLRAEADKKRSSLISQVEKQGAAFDKAMQTGSISEQTSATDALRQSLENLAVAFPNVSDSILASAKKITNWKDAVAEAKKESEDFIKYSKNKSLDDIAKNITDYFEAEYKENESVVVGAENTRQAKDYLINKSYSHHGIGDWLYGTSYKDPETGKWTTYEKYFGAKGTEQYYKSIDGKNVKLLSMYQQGKRSSASDENKAFVNAVDYVAKNRYYDVYKRLTSGDTSKIEKTDLDALWDDVIDYLYSDLGSSNTSKITSGKQDIPNILRSLINPDVFDEDGINGSDVLDAYINKLKKDINKNTNAYFDENGNVNFAEVLRHVSLNLLEPYREENRTDFAKGLVDEYGEQHKYSVGGEEFASSEEAEMYASRNNIPWTQIQRDGSPLYPSTYDRVTTSTNTQLTQNTEQANARDRYLRRLARSSSRERLAGYYDRRANAVELESLFTNNPLLKELDYAEQQNKIEWSDYQNIAQKMLAGESIDGVIADLMMIQLITNRNNIADEITKENGPYANIYKTLQQFYGEEQFAEIIRQSRAGTLSSNQNLLDFISRTSAEKGVKVGTGRTITNKEATDLARNLYSRNFQSLAEAQTAMTEEGWTTDEWSAIQSKYPEIISLLQMKPEQRVEEQEGINLDRNIQIKLNISGISELEEAGKVVQGTTQLLEDLQKNGNVSIKTQLQFGSEMHENQQRALMLENGTYEEQNAAMRAYGISDIEIQKDRAGSLRRAGLMADNEREAFAGTLNELARLGQVEIAADWAKQNGYEITDALYSYEDAVKFMDRYGFNVLSNGDVVGQGSGKINDEMTQLFWNMTQGKYTYTGKGANIDQINPFLNAQQHYSQTDIAQAQRKILNGFSRDQFEDKNLYDTAAQSMSTYGTEFRRMVERNREAVSVGGTAVYGSAEMRRAKELADLEASQNEREAERQQLTEQLNMSSSRYIRENAQQIVSARDIFTNGSFAEQLGLISGYSDTMRALQQAQYGLEGGNTPENREYISSLLGLSDEQVDEMFQNGQEGELQTAINDKVKEFYQKLATEMLPEELLTSLDFDTMSLDDIISSLDQVPEDLRELIEPFLKAINEAKNGVEGDNTYKSLSDVASSSLESTRKRGAAMTEVYDTLWGEGGESSFSERVSALQQNKNVDWGSIDNGLLYMVNSFGQEGSAITEDMINDAYYNALYGRKASPETQQATMNSLFGGNMSGQNMIDTYRDWMQNQEQYAAEINAFNSLDHSDELANILKSEGVSVNTAEKALRKYNEQVNEDKLKDVTQFSKGSANLASALSKIKKGGKDASEGTEMIRKNIEGFQDQMTAISKAQGKSGKQLDTKTLGFIDSLFPEISADEIKQLSTDRLAELLEGAEDAVNEAATDDFQAIWDSMVDDLSLNYDLSNITVNPDGTLNLDALDDTARAAVEAAIARLEAYAGDLASLTFVQEEGKEKINLKALISKNANGKYHGRGGGGGGGGKSAADKLLEKQKFDVSAIQHDQKMLEIQEKNYDRYNDDAAYRDNVNQQIQVQQRLADQYQKNIQEIENMRRSTKEGSDDWNKLTESLWAAQEAFAGVAEAVDALYAKMDAQQKQIYEYNATLLEHQKRMSEIDYTFYQNVNDPESSISEIERQLGIIGETEINDRTRRQEIIDYMEDEYLRNGESDRYKELVTERDSLTEKIAQSVNDRFALDAQRLDVQRQYQQNNEIPYTHDLNMINSQMQRAEMNEDTETYNKLFERRQQIWDAEEQRNNEYIAELEMLMAYYNSAGQTQNALNTLQEINSLQEENDDLFNQRLQARKDNLQKEQDATRESLNRQTMTQEHQNAGYAQMAGAYKRAGDHGAYRSMLQKQIENWRKMITVQKQLLKIEVEKLKTMVKETEEYYRQLELVYEIEGKITELESNIANAEMDIMDDIVDEMIEGVDRINDLSNHIQKLIKDQQQMYQNQGNWDAYFVMAEKRREEMMSSVADMTAQVVQLKAEMASVPYGGGAWDNLRTKVLSLEESISSARVELENFDRELEGIKVDRMLDEINRHEANRTHNITLMQYEQTRYQTKGELTNYGIMLQKEIDYREENSTVMEEELALMREELENINLSEKDYYRLTDAIKKKEEALSQNNNAIEKNTKLLRQNEQAIRKTRLDLEQMVLKVIEENIKKQRDMLNNTVEMEDIILNVIKRRYQDEWDLIRQDEEKKKEALEKEKALINERLNYRKQAMEAENKYSELADYQRQLALISADPTRSKESKELSRKIDELRQDIRWDEASQQAEAATERIEDEINAINEYVQIHGENLNQMLMDANNFAAEVKEVLSGSYEDIVLWLQQNDIDYQNSLDDRKKQMEQGWRDTWLAMKGIVETYWDQIEEILSSQDSFMQFMYENSLEYANASVTGQLQLASQWEDGWTSAANAVNQAIQAINYTPDIHEDFTPQNADQALQDALNWNYDDSWYNVGGSYSPSFTDFEDVTKYGLDEEPKEETQPETPPETQPETLSGSTPQSPSEYAGEPAPTPTPSPAPTPTPSPAPTNTPQSNNVGTSTYDVYDRNGFKTTYSVQASSKDEAQRIVNDKYGTSYSATTHTSTSAGVGGSNVATGVPPLNIDISKPFNDLSNAVGNVLGSFFDGISDLGAKAAEANKQNQEKLLANKQITGPNAEGGLVDYTGLAWVDGSMSKPEAFLSAYDTANIKALTDALNYVNIEPFRVPNLDKINTGNQTIGDINITINGAEMKDDADFEDVARRVGQEFTKQLRKEGLNLANYAF